MGVIGVFCAVLAGFNAGCADLTAQQRTWLAEGRQAYEAQRYAQAHDTLSRFLNEVQGKPEVSEALYVRGMAAAKLGKRPAAYEDLRRAALVAANSDSRWRANATLGTLYFEDSRWSDAAEAIAVAIENMPPTRPMDLLLFRLGVCRERSGRWGDAQEPYRRIVREFPTSETAEGARRRLALRPSHFAVQCGVFSVPTNAENQVIDLKRRGLDAYSRQEMRDGRTVIVVLAGRYATYEQALAGLSVVKGYVPGAVLWP